MINHAYATVGIKPTDKHEVTFKAPTVDCIALKDFGLFENGIPSKLLLAAEMLGDGMESSPDWPVQIANSLNNDFSTSKHIVDLLNGDMDDLTLRDSALIFYWYFRSVQKCGRARSFIDRAMDEQDCESTDSYSLCI